MIRSLVALSLLSISLAACASGGPPTTAAPPPAAPPPPPPPPPSVAPQPAAPPPSVETVADTAPTDRLVVGQEAPQFTIKTLNDKKSGFSIFALRNFVGADATEKKRAVVLSFGASYCEPCKKELAEFKKLKPKLDASNVLLVVVVIDTEPEGIEKMRALTVDELGLEYPVLSDRFGVLARRYYASSLPMTVVVKPDGRIQWVNTGFQPDAIDKLLAELAIAK